MSNRIYNTNKVVGQIGLKNQINYDNIEIYIDITNHDNIWAKVFLTDFSKNKPEQREEIKYFNSNSAMIKYVRSHFNSYELDHPVDFLQKHIFFHHVDYINMVYYNYAGNNEYLELNYYEFTNGKNEVKSERFKKEDKHFVHNILKTSKRIPLNVPIDSKYINYSQNEVNRIRRIRPDELNYSKKREKKIHNLKVIMSVAALTALLSGGIKLVKNTVETEDILTQDNFTITKNDVDTFLNKKKASIIIDKLMNEDYRDITNDEMHYIRKYIRDVELSNYDYNSSTNMFNLDSYFSDKIFWNKKEDSSELIELLNRINKLYKNCFDITNGKVVLSKDNANRYISYVASLIFMYDTTVDLRGSNQVNMSTQSLTSSYATKEDISNYEKFPLILKYIISNQLSTMIMHTDYTVEREPSNYFGKLDKYSLNGELKKRIDLMIEEMDFQVNYGNKTI